MFRIIILHELVVISKHIFKEWYKCTVENISVQRSIHFSFKDADPTPSLKADATPHMHFHRMFGPAGYL